MKAQVQIHTAKPSSVRDVNRSIILNMIRLHYPISRAELSERTGIFRSNVSGIVDELIGLALVKEERAIPAGRGRVPFHLYLNDEGLRVIGVSIRPTRTMIALAGLSGQFHRTITVSTPERPDVLVRCIADAVAEIREDLPVGDRDIEEICVSVPGLVDVSAGSIRWASVLTHYSGFPLRSAIEEATGVQTAVDNDCNLAAIAELWLSDRHDAPLTNFAFMEVGSVGIGGGIIVHHELYRGHDSSFAAEYGHMVVDLSGPHCMCGRRGCLELFASDRATWNRWRPHEEFAPERFGEMIEAARAGEAEAVAAVEESARILSIAISNIVFSLNPSVIVLGGRLTELWDRIEKPITHALDAANISVSVRPASVASDELFLQGAVTMAASKAFAKPKFGF